MGGVKGHVLTPPASTRPGEQLSVNIAGLKLRVRLSQLCPTSQPASPDAVDIVPAPKPQEPGVQGTSQRAKRREGVATTCDSAEQGHEELAGIEFQTSFNTIDVRGKRAADALAIIEDELFDKASMGTVFVVHGVGTGALRMELHRFLKMEPMVRSFFLEPDSNGGCTVVKL
jgi:Smr domain